MNSRMFYGYGRLTRAGRFLRDAHEAGIETDYFHLTGDVRHVYLGDTPTWSRDRYGTVAAVTRLSELVESARAAKRAGRPEPEVRTLLVFPDPNTLIDLLES
jgi:hypothetical protein